jgi:predicted nucleic acid-binding Zn ribbon protein
LRRREPRPIAAALRGLTAESAPATVLARVQGCWPDVVGKVIAVEAQPVSEREGTLTVACRSGTWANELELLAPDLLEKLNTALGGTAGTPLRRLRATVARTP